MSITNSDNVDSEVLGILIPVANVKNVTEKGKGSLQFQ